MLCTQPPDSEKHTTKAKMPRGRPTFVPDELIDFMECKLFQIPVRQFMDENSLIFDKNIPTGEEHEKIFESYKRLIDLLLDTFCRDAQITLAEAHKSISEMGSIATVKEVFQVLFEQIEASESFDIFYKVMEQRNLAIQQQVIAMTMALWNGQVPECMTPADEEQMQRDAKKSRGGGIDAAVIAPVADKQEEKVLAEVIRMSQKQYTKESELSRKEEKMLKQTIEISKKEADLIQEDRRDIENGLKHLALIDEPVERAASACGQRRPPPIAPATASTSASKKSSADAASDWMKSAQAENTGHAVAAVAASGQKVDPAVMQQRADFMKKQRDKLLELKKKANEEQLRKVEGSSQRPRSARVARSVVEKGADMEGGAEREDQKKLQIKFAIAEKLRQEVLRK